MVLCHKQDASSATDPSKIEGEIGADKVEDRAVLVQASRKEGLGVEVLEGLLEEIVKEKEARKSQISWQIHKTPEIQNVFFKTRMFFLYFE